VTALRGSAMSRFNSGANIANPALLTQCRLGHFVFKGEANFDLICRSGEAWVTRIEVNYRSRVQPNAQATLAIGIFLNSNITISLAGRGGLNRKPCISTQPSARRRSNCSCVSTPSAVVVM